MANTGSKNRRKRDGKRGSGRKPAPTKDLGSTTAAAVADLTPEPNSPIVLASEAFARQEATAAAVAVLEAAMQAQSIEGAPEAAPVSVETAQAEVRDRAGPQVRVKVSSGESRGSSSQNKVIEAGSSEVKVSRWLRDVSEPKPVVPVVIAAPARPRGATTRAKIPTYVDQPRRSTTWLWVFAAAIALVTWIMLDRPSNEHRLAASATPPAPIAERAPAKPSAPMVATPKTPAPMERTVVAQAPDQATPLRVPVGQPPEVAKVVPLARKPEVAKVAPPEVIVAPEVVVEVAPEPVHVTPEILALAERISADEPPAVVRKGPARRVSTAPRATGKAVNSYDEVPPKAAAYQPRDYDDVLPLSGVRASDDESLSRGRQYDHVPPRAAFD